MCFCPSNQYPISIRLTLYKRRARTIDPLVEESERLIRMNVCLSIQSLHPIRIRLALHMRKSCAIDPLVKEETEETEEK